jgi:hypothetical protein
MTLENFCINFILSSFLLYSLPILVHLSVLSSFLFPSLSAFILPWRWIINIAQSMLLQRRRFESYHSCYILCHFNTFSEVNFLCEHKQAYVHSITLLILKTWKYVYVLKMTRKGLSAINAICQTWWVSSSTVSAGKITHVRLTLICKILTSMYEQKLLPWCCRVYDKGSFFIWFMRLLALRQLLAYCASLGW